MATKAATIPKARVRKTRPRWVRWFKRLVAVGFLFFLIGFTAFGVIFVNEMRKASVLMGSLPDKLRQYSTAPTRIMSRDGKLLYSVQSEFREPVKYEDIPKHVRDAIVAAEDKRFFDHSGVDYWAMGRILVVGAKEGRLSQGGSTLTMQLAKRFYSEGERTFNRKLQDVALATTMERDMSKEQILTLYLNTMYFGERAYGIQAASEVYFGKKDLNDLTIAEAAMLARCVRRPSDVNPVRNLQASIDNRNTVLGIMRDEHMITQPEYDEGIAEKVKLAPRKDRVTSQLHRAPYFVDQVLGQLDDDFPDIDFKAGGYTVFTTLDTGLQAFAEKSVKAFLKKHADDKVNSACFVLMDKQGQILAEVGGRDYQKSQFNIVTQGLLQPGSSFKAYLYSAALSTGAITMDTSLGNEPFEYDMGPHAKPWIPKNSSSIENRYRTSVYAAFAGSYNVAAAHVMEMTGPQTVKAMATSVFGIKSLNRQGAHPSMALGAVEVHPLEMAQGYSVFMLHGDRATPYCINKVVGPDGSIVRSYAPRIFRNQLDPWVCEQMNELLHLVVTGGTASQALGDAMPNARGKTGTTSDNKDAWFCGYQDGLVGISWCGNMVVRKGQVFQLPMGSHMYGGTAPAYFWRDIMQYALKKGFGSKVPDVKPAVEPEPKDDEKQDETKVKVIPPPDEVVDPSGTTGGDGAPITVPDPNATNGGADGGDGATPPVNPAGAPDSPSVHRDPPKRHDDPRRGEDNGDTVRVDICAESGMRATIYCPETVTRTFRKGSEPKKRCTIHGG